MSDLPPLRNPYRASALFHAGLAVVILVFAGLTGGDLTRAVAFAALYFVAATGCEEHADNPPLEDHIKGTRGDNGHWTWEVLLD